MNRLSVRFFMRFSLRNFGQVIDLLPSLRALAKDLKVGVLTVNRAYTELENEGYIESVQGKGCFVAKKSADLIKQHLMEEATKKIEQAIGEIRKAGASDEEIFALFDQCFRRTNR